MIPKWKLIRELKRVRSQLRALIDFFYDPFLRRVQYARRLKRGFSLLGTQPLTSNIAILLVYQPQGIAKSTISTCRHLIDNGYAVVLVLNSRVSAEDLNRLRAVSWTILQRKNFGYDFGGYQDAIWYLQHHAVRLDALLILNDSIWFPVLDGVNVLASMGSHCSDFIGALQLEAYRKEQSREGTKPPFFGSFFMHLKSSAIQHPRFVEFWREYKATSNKYITIRRGERHFSRCLMDAGISHSYVYSRRMFDAWIEQVHAGELANILTDLVSMDVSHDVERQRLLQATAYDDEAWSNNAIKLIFKMTEKQNILSSAPIAAASHFQIPYIKKSADPHNLQALRLVAQRHHEGRVQINQEVYEEICELLDRHRIPPS
jgi:Rhamnan synthesis protein F